MAISRHDPEWKRVIFMALAADVRFQQTLARYGERAVAYPKPTWYSYLPDPMGHAFRGFSKFEAAVNALRYLGVDETVLPAAAAKCKVR